MEYGFDLGTFTRPLPGTTPDAQRWCDRGLVWLFGYNHEEAIVCFERAVAADPGAALAHWGIAYAIGPNYNKPWKVFTETERAPALTRAHAAIAAARACPPRGTVEAALIGALAARYPDDPETEEFQPYLDAFADAMRPVYAKYSDDLDVACVFAEALMTRTAW